MKKFEDLTLEEQSKIELYRIRHGEFDDFLDSGEGILDKKGKYKHKNLDASCIDEKANPLPENSGQQVQTGLSLSSAYSKFIFNIGCLLALYR